MVLNSRPNRSLEPPSERLMTSAPFATAYRIASATAAGSPTPSASSTFSGMIFASGAIPITPRPLSPMAATEPATWAPWPFWSSGRRTSSTKS